VLAALCTRPEHCATPCPKSCTPNPNSLCLPVTGEPKGIIHTHASVSCEVEAIREFLDHNKVGLTCEDVYFSFLPLAHIFDRCALRQVRGVWESVCVCMCAAVAGCASCFEAVTAGRHVCGCLRLHCRCGQLCM
jgi:hypothetical protein